MGPPELPVVVQVEPPLGGRRFVMVCGQRTVRELKDEIARRLPALAHAPLELAAEGRALMDDAAVGDLVAPRATICVRLPGGLLDSPRVTVSKVELGEGRVSKDARTFVAESLYESLAQHSLDDEDEDSSSSSASGSACTDHGEECGSCAEALAGQLEPRLRRYVGLLTAEVLDALPAADYAELEPHDLIAYQVLEVAADITPSVSPYRIGRLVAADSDAATVRVYRDLAPPPDAAVRARDAGRRSALAPAPGPVSQNGPAAVPSADFHRIKRI
ncbi:hypothetical protein IWQ57_005487 [Coemansia nantahalensis]|uniref:Uncharacterized protein n=1 Tax=Coemansia nantahalensis TaxID=2789366 RepID=A0ACC1JMC5_9FUNG|nr:hypothetical protein IWQ57_005487 [Coemansia nantahalensis]